MKVFIALAVLVACVVADEVVEGKDPKPKLIECANPKNTFDGKSLEDMMKQCTEGKPEPDAEALACLVDKDHFNLDKDNMDDFIRAMTLDELEDKYVEEAQKCKTAEEGIGPCLFTTFDEKCKELNKNWNKGEEGEEKE